MGTSRNRWYNRIVFRLSLFFLVVAIIVITFCGSGIFYVQTMEFEDQSIIEMTHIGTMIRDDIIREGDVFAPFQEYMLEHSNEIIIPYDFGDEFVDEAEDEFNREFKNQFPDKIFRQDIGFRDLPDELKNLFCTYYHARWFLYFEKIRKWFDIPYAYYVYPSGNGSHVIYVFDTERTHEGDESENRLHLCDDFEEDYTDMPYLFNTWSEGKMLEGMDSFDNEYGRTYSYYIPLYINDVKTGLVCIDMDIDYVNSNIIKNVVRLVSMSAIVMLVGLAIIALAIHRRYIIKLLGISDYIYEYMKNKDVKIADLIDKNITGKDEIAVLGSDIAEMIRDLDEYMNNLNITEKELEQTKETAKVDPLTGVNNKHSYDEETKKIQNDIDNGNTDVGIAMVDLNFLKQINDNYGHDKGNIAIKRISRILCDVFIHSPVFRVGGDEFVVVLRDSDFESREELIRELYRRLDVLEKDRALEPWEKVSAALGLAVYDPENDTDLESVFKRADEAMYIKKKEMKKGRGR